MTTRRTTLRALLAAPLALPAIRAHAQGRSLRIVVPFGPGSEPDILARRLANVLPPILDQPVVVDNRVGANTVIAATHVAQQRPDGETVLLTSSSTFATLPNLHARPAVRLEQFEPMSITMRAHMVLYVANDVPADGIPELVRWANAQPQPILYGANRGALGHLCGERMKQVTGIRMSDVSFRGSTELQQFLMRGDVKLAFDGAPAHAEMVNAGRYKALGITADRRVPLLPNVPTLAETGFGDIAFSYWYGTFVPRGTPRAAVERLTAAFHRAQRAEEVTRQFAAQGAVLDGNTPDQFTRLIEQERETIGALVRSIGLTLD